MVSPAREEFTMKNLLNRSFGTSMKSVREAVIGGTSFSGCLTAQLVQVPAISDMKCIPSITRPAPGRLGYFIGNYIVRTHSKERGVDGVQVELPMSVRTKQEDKKEGIISYGESSHDENFKAHNWGFWVFQNSQFWGKKLLFFLCVQGIIEYITLGY